MIDLVIELRKLRLEDMQDNKFGQLDMTSIREIKDAFIAAGWTPPAQPADEA